MSSKLGRWVAIALFAGTASVASAAKTHGRSTAASEKSEAVTPEQLKWGPAPAGLPTGIQAVVLEGDPTQPGLFVIRLRAPDGSEIRPHWHPQAEHITVISGQFEMGMGDRWDPAHMKVLPAGGYVSVPARHRHFARSRGETVVQVSGMGPYEIHYVNPSDDPRK
jgi:quercetin dioxygenase-like cupin family protein